MWPAVKDAGVNDPLEMSGWLDETTLFTFDYANKLEAVLCNGAAWR